LQYFQEDSDFYTDYKFWCDLPSVPIGPKLLHLNNKISDENSTKYKLKVAELQTIPLILTNPFLDVELNLINHSQYLNEVEEGKKVKLEDLDPRDLELMDESSTQQKKKKGFTKHD
jgi:hypothetical protein